MVVAIERFGRYEIVRKLSRSMTDVYLAHDPESNCPVVLKIIEQSRDEFTRLVIEAESRGAELQRHLHRLDRRILQIYDFGEKDGCFFVAMEYFKGRTLAEILMAEGRLAPKRAARYAAESCNQLRTLHSFASNLDGRRTAVVHGDIKPSNIQIGADDELKLLDFGIAKVITSTHNLTRHNLGSPSYCSPERLSRAQVDPQADLWALGVSLYEMLAGSPPYQAQDTRRLENLIQSRRAPRALPDSCPAALRSIVGKALAADLERRYQSAAAFEADLLAFLADRPTAASRERTAFWDSNATVETVRQPVVVAPTRQSPPPHAARPPEAPRPAANALPVSVLAQPARRTFHSRVNVAIALLTGVLAGLILFIPAAFYLRLRSESRGLAAPKDYSRASEQTVAADWRLYEELNHRQSSLGGLLRLPAYRSAFRASLVASANNVLTGFRHSSETDPARVNWAAGRRLLLYALRVDPNDRKLRGELALFDGYLNFTQQKPQPVKWNTTIEDFRRAAAALPNSADPHLALARVYTYGLHNIGAAQAEFHLAEQLGAPPGPREEEEEGDGYLYRAEWELNRARRSAAAAKSDENKWLQVTRNDLERARNYYEPIAGFSHVSDHLDELANDSSEQMKLADELLENEAAKERAKAAVAAAAKSRWKKMRSSHRWR